jgi:hypothetical protein
MICKLCGSDGKLIEAHIIPRSFFRLDPKDKTPARLITNVEGRYAQSIPKGVYDKGIVCESCERTFARWDDYGADLLVKNWASIQPLMAGSEHVGYGLPAYDYAALKLFFLSLLWRAAVSTHPMFEKVDLGPRESGLKQSILSGDAGDMNHFGVVLQAFDDDNVGMLNPEPERLQKLRFIRFYLAHIIAFIKVDSQPFADPLDEIALNPGKPLTLLKKLFVGSRERKAMLNVVHAQQKAASAAAV